MFDRIDRIFARLCRGIEVLCGLVLALMTGVIGLLVFTRNFLGYSYSWSEEMTRFLLIWLSLLGAAVITYRNDHIRFDFLAGYLSDRFARGLGIVLNILIIAFLVLLLVQSWDVALARSATRSPALSLPLTVPYLAIPISTALMVFACALNIARDIRSFASADPRR